MNITKLRVLVKLYKKSQCLQINRLSNKTYSNFNQARKIADEQSTMIKINPVLTERLELLQKQMNKKNARGIVFLDRMNALVEKNKSLYNNFAMLRERVGNARFESKISLLFQNSVLTKTLELKQNSLTKSYDKTISLLEKN